MARWIVTGLIVLNILLGVGVYLRFGEKTARADIGKPTASIVTVAGQSGGNSIIYVLDTSTGWLVALKSDVVNKKVELAARQKISDDIARFGR